MRPIRIVIMKNWLIKLVALFVLLPFASLSLAAQVTYYDTNNVGTPVAMWDAGARKVWETEYYPFGKEYQTSTAIKNNDRKFVGKEKDKETDLTYFGARYYDDLSGRFLAPDPVRPVDALTSKTNHKVLDNPQRLNRYAYGLNNPYRYVDPDGRDAILVEYRGYKVDTGFGFKLPLGHSAVIAVDNNSGLTNYFEYGRYGGDFGKVRQMSVPNLEMKDGRPTEKSIENLHKYISEHYGQNKTVDATYHNDADFKKTVNFATERMNDPNRKAYDKFDNNCKTFAAEAVKAGKEHDNKRKKNK